MRPAEFRKIKRYLPRRDKCTGRPGWAVQAAHAIGKSRIYVYKAAKDRDGLHSDALDEWLRLEADRQKQGS